MPRLTDVAISKCTGSEVLVDLGSNFFYVVDLSLQRLELVGKCSDIRDQSMYSLILFVNLDVLVVDFRFGCCPHL